LSGISIAREQCVHAASKQSGTVLIEVSCTSTVHHTIDRMVSEHWRAYTEYEIRNVFVTGLWPYYSMNYVNVPRAIFTLAARFIYGKVCQTSAETTEDHHARSLRTSGEIRMLNVPVISLVARLSTWKPDYKYDSKAASVITRRQRRFQPNIPPRAILNPNLWLIAPTCTGPSGETSGALRRCPSTSRVNRDNKM
jgi:hypothetical protein